MRDNIDKRANASRDRYKEHHDAQEREETRSRIGQLVNLDCTPLSTSAADKMAEEAYSKFAPARTRTLWVSSTTSHTVNPGQKEIPNTVSADWASPASTDMHRQDDIVDDGHSQPLPYNCSRNPGNRKDQPEQDKDSVSKTEAHFFYHIVGHVGSGR